MYIQIIIIMYFISNIQLIHTLCGIIFFVSKYNLPKFHGPRVHTVSNTETTMRKYTQRAVQHSFYNYSHSFNKALRTVIWWGFFLRRRFRKTVVGHPCVNCQVGASTAHPQSNGFEQHYKYEFIYLSLDMIYIVIKGLITRLLINIDRISLA